MKPTESHWDAVSFNLRVPAVCTSLFKGLLVPAKCPCFLWAMRSIASFLFFSELVFDDWISLKRSPVPLQEVCEGAHSFIHAFIHSTHLDWFRLCACGHQDPILILCESHEDLQFYLLSTARPWTDRNTPNLISLSC